MDVSEISAAATLEMARSLSFVPTDTSPMVFVPAQPLSFTPSITADSFVRFQSFLFTASLSLPSATAPGPLALVFVPKAVARCPSAFASAPTATERVSLAVAAGPTATELVPVA